MKALLSMFVVALIAVSLVGCKTVNHDDMTTKQHQSSASGLSS